MQGETRFHDRRAVQIENERIRVTVTVEGGHIAEILHKQSGVNPLWTPPWPSIEPSTYDPARHPEYGRNMESRLLSGIMGHNLCLDLFGAPSEAEAAAGIDVHGEASMVPYEITATGQGLSARCKMPIAQLAFERKIELSGARVQIAETVENLSALDRPIAWTQHVTLGPPFLEKGATQFRAPIVPAEGEEFDWVTSRESSGSFTPHLINAGDERAYFLAWSPRSKVLFSYVWPRADFPWLGIWEENRSRSHGPWNSRTLTRGMEFGVSPFPETRRQMIERKIMLDTPCYRWIEARSKLHAEYYATISAADSIPDSVE